MQKDEDVLTGIRYKTCTFGKSFNHPQISTLPLPDSAAPLSIPEHEWVVEPSSSFGHSQDEKGGGMTDGIYFLVLSVSGKGM